MNKKKRDALGEAISALNKATVIIDNVKDKEEDDMDALPENMQDGDRHYKMESAVESLASAVEKIESAIEYIYDAMI